MSVSSANDRRIASQLAKGCPESGHIEMKSAFLPNIVKTVLLFALGIALTLFIWQCMAWYCNDIRGLAMGFPTPVESIAYVFDHLDVDIYGTGKNILEHLCASLKRLVIAFLLASIVGVIIGSILGFYSKIYSIGIVPVTVFQSIPGLAWVPIALLLFGLGDDASIFIIFAVSCMVITTNVAGGIRMVPQTIVRAAGMMGATPSIMFIKVLIPYALVSIISGLRVGLGSAWRVLIAAEMLIGTGIGLGSAMEFLRDNLDFVGAFGCIVVICAMGLFIDKIIFSSIEKYARHKLGMEEGY